MLTILALLMLSAIPSPKAIDCSVNIMTPGHSGSGVVMKGGYVLTSAHVVDDCVEDKSKYDIVVWQDVYKKGKYIRRNITLCRIVQYSHLRLYDLALLEPLDVDFVKSSTKLYVGEVPELGTDVWHVGNYKSRYPGSLAQGILSQYDRKLPDTGPRHDQIQILSFSGSSGGGVFYADGTVAGILCHNYVPNTNLSFMVPSRIIIEWLSTTKYKGQFE